MIEKNVCNLGLQKDINGTNNQRQLLNCEHAIRIQISIKPICKLS